MLSEAQTCLAAITAATDHGMMRVQLESDCMVLIKALNSTYDQLPGGVLFREVKFLFSRQFAYVDVNYIPRSCNGWAHALARMSISWDPDETCIWVDAVPKFEKTLMVYDIDELSMI